ncbi:MAG: ferrous iron transport protein B [Clostridiales bacterium]|nr:ferrous iron transport protein B [Clostridiales bacterium]
MKQEYALAGNPNCGKTTLFNALTGSNQYVGNWPGVTVEKKAGPLRGRGDISVVDLPGIYSLSPYSAEEMVTRSFVMDGQPAVILDVVDATNLERNLYLTLQLAELGRPLVVALNMMDMLKSRGVSIDVQRLEHLLDLPVAPLSASRGKGVRELIDRSIHAAANRGGEPAAFDEQRLAERAEQRYAGNSYILHQLHDRREHHGEEYRSTHVIDEIYTSEVMEAILRIEDIIEPKCMKKKMPLRWSAVKIIDDDAPTLEALELTDGESHLIEEIVQGLEAVYGERDMIIADQKYRFICRVCAQCLTRLKEPGELTLSDRIDSVVTHKYLALPLFLGVMLLVFYLTFGPLGTFLTDGLEGLIGERFQPWAVSSLTEAGAAPWAVSLVCDGVIQGVGSIVSFFPQILLLFFFLSLLEDSGYMARAAFIMDKLLHRTGLSGRSFVPMLMGFGCSVPGVMAARTLENERDRRMTIILTPFMSCSAKMPVYALFIAAFFPAHQGLVVFGIYAAGVITAILCAMLLRKTVLRGGHAPFVMELPPYRLPTFRTLSLHLYERVKDFAVRAGTILVAASVAVWFLQSFNGQLEMLPPERAGESLLAGIGRTIAPLFAPLGFGFWQAAVALVSGFVAKEAVVGTLTILYNPATDAGLYAALQGVFTPVSALSFLIFVLLYMPCVAAFSAIRREMNSWKWAAGTVLFQTGVAWTASLLVYQFGTLAVNLTGRL